MTSMDNVLQLVNRLQSACTLLGDTAGGKDSDLPTLWNMLPSIVVIGGQVNMAELAAHLTERDMEDEVCSGFSTGHAEVPQPAEYTVAWLPHLPRHGAHAAESATGIHSSGHSTDAAEVCCKTLRPAEPQATPMLARDEACLPPATTFTLPHLSEHCVSLQAVCKSLMRPGQQTLPFPVPAHVQCRGCEVNCAVMSGQPMPLHLYTHDTQAAAGDDTLSFGSLTCMSHSPHVGDNLAHKPAAAPSITCPMHLLTLNPAAVTEFGQELCAGGRGRQGLPATWHRHCHAPSFGATIDTPGRP